MLLAVDIGNTNISAGIFEKSILTDSFKFSHKTSADFNCTELEKYIRNKRISQCIISSVVDEMTLPVKNAIRATCSINPHIVTHNMKFGIEIELQKSKHYGIDRIVNACAANTLYNKSAIVVDMGTATTFDVIDCNHRFIGGVIIPGVETQLKSLAKNTSKLPDIDLSEANNIKSVINTDTKNAIFSGVVIGHAHAISGLINDCRNELNCEVCVIATGGNAELIAKYTKKFDIIDKNLTLKGLQIVHQINF